LSDSAIYHYPGKNCEFPVCGQTTRNAPRLLFTETPQKIFAHLLTFGPTPQYLVEWMADPEEIDRRVQNTEMAMMIGKGAISVLGSITIVHSLNAIHEWPSFLTRPCATRNM
jgi:hypothetical protein